MENQELDLLSLTDKEVIVDIDGTIAVTGDRAKLLEGDNPDWDTFFKRCSEDEVYQDIVDLVKLLSNFVSIRFCTGRPERVRKETKKWLKDVFGGTIPDSRLLMRKDGDHRTDSEIKPELIKESGIKLSQIAFILEDRNSMVKKWRELGVRCLQVQETTY